MSRIGKQPVTLPEGVKAEVSMVSGERFKVAIQGPKGNLEEILPRGIGASEKEGQLIILPRKNMKNTSALWGLSRSLVANMVEGVVNGYGKKLVVEGVGFRASVSGNKLVLNLGLSHPVEMEAPEGITFSAEKNVISISGIDKQLVGQVAAKIRAKKKPEPYKGKGIRYEDEVVRRKSGKKAASGTE